MSRDEKSTGKVTGEVEDTKLILITAKRDALFQRMQSIYDQAKIAHLSDEGRQSFITSCVTIDSIRLKFHDIIDEYNEQLLMRNPTAKPNFQAYNAFEDIYCNVKQVLSQVSPTCSSFKLNKASVKLPPIELLTFDGDIQNWPLFYASFKETIHDNPSLSNSDKLYYLMGKLSPKVQSLFSGTLPSAQNYEIIFKALLDRFQNNDVLGSSYLEQILNLKLSNSPAAYQLFMDKFVTVVNSLKNLGIDNLTDFILMHIAVRKFDTNTIRAYETYAHDSKLPKFESFIEFIKMQCRICQTTNALSPANNNTNSYSKINRTRVSPNPQTYVSSENKKCPLCNSNAHDHMFKCHSFAKITPHDRFKFVKENGACVNCLSTKHRSKACTSKVSCRACQQRHHTLLHFETHTPVNDALSGNVSATSSSPPQPNISPPVPLVSAPSPSGNLVLCSMSDRTVLLATAQVVVYDTNSTPHIVRCLLDSASQSNFITYECCVRLGLLNKLQRTSTVIRGLGGSLKTAEGSVDLVIHSRFNLNINYNISSLMVDRITDTLPSAPVDISAFSHLRSLPLADGNFATPGPVDLLIGSSLFPHLLMPGIVHSRFSNIPPAIQTVLGFVIMGSVPTSQVVCNYSTTCCTVTDEPVDSILKKFWELEEISAPHAQSLDDLECEEYFSATTSRDESGRYIVALPFREDVYTLGDSYAAAHRRFVCLEKKLEACPKTRTAYNNVIREYLDKGYLSPVEARDDESLCPAYYIPHHGVVREDKSSTRLRIVLDASCKTTSGRSLNNILHSGENLQGDLFSILINFRLFKICFSADCRQMFLQIGIREPDCRFQRILFRFNPSDPLTVYQFNRVCFGLKSSPFHALRVVRQLVIDEGDKYPAASAAISAGLYMDDIVLSSMSTLQAIDLSSELIALFKRAQLDLVKWTSNSDEVLSHIPESHRDSNDKLFGDAAPHKILGLFWDRSRDSFRFKVVAPDDTCTKRTILSAVARLWDLLGFVAPVLLHAKLLIKELWLLKCDWDDQPPPHIVTAWKQVCLELPSLNDLCIPRHLGLIKDCQLNILGFADASERAYGAVVYFQICVDDRYSIQLVCAKSKVSPVKVLSVARLELCAAVLLSKLIRKVVDTVSPRYPVDKIYAFSDSKVVLCWVRSSPHRWQTFVANRVVKIVENVPASCFHHVAGSENPADCLSRGLTPSKIMNHPLWFNGPPWAASDSSRWQLNDDCEQSNDDAPERRTNVHVVVANDNDSPLYSLMNRFSSLSKLLRSIVYVFKFIKKLPQGNSISSSDLEFAEVNIIRAVQQVHFSSELASLQTDKPCSPAFNKLRPFLDKDGLIRVGGRLSNSAEDYTCKHPVILPRRDNFVDILVDFYHKRHLHAGPELLMALLRQRFWILSARGLIRHRINKCNTCFRAKPRPQFPLMADLPSHRVNQVDKPFQMTGCDYAGPVQYTPVRGRGVKSRKAWLCIFTCMTTRATHIEVATDLSTVSFLAALKRFLSRRGPVKCMYTDNGTCFVGASSYLRDLYKFLDELRPHLEVELSENRIDWKFIPPASPHFGGCWESIVKIVKTHLFKVIGEQILSYEELITVLAQIEALVNSRPLTAMSSDPSEPSVLTPAHFLNTAPLSSIPAAEVQPHDLHQRHSLLDSIVQSFWRRWRSEYLHKLQSRAKWNTPTASIAVGTVVVIVTENAPPFSWPLAIVEKVHPSKDGTTRVVTVKTSKGSYLRPVVRLCPIPNQ